MDETPVPLSQLSIFGALQAESLKRVGDVLNRRQFSKGEAIIREGDEADGLYVLIGGLVEVSVEIDGKRCPIAELGEGAVFGEMAIIDIMPRSADVTALTDADTLYLSRVGFFELFDYSPGTFAMLSLNLARELSRRLRRADSLLARAGIVHADDSAVRTRLLMEKQRKAKEEG